MTGLEQSTAVNAAGPRPPAGALRPASLARPQLQTLSVEHAALALALPPGDLRLIECLGSGLPNGAIARRMKRSPKTVKTRLHDLSRRTGMTRLSLAVMGYHLLGQY
ncbi:MAG: hypothetical protein ABSD56_01635 [Bryobacteraceae bacterium]